jgi:hypothetical protein
MLTETTNFETTYKQVFLRHGAKAQIKPLCTSVPSSVLLCETKFHPEEPQSLPERNTKFATSMLKKMILVGLFLLLGLRGWGQDTAYIMEIVCSSQIKYQNPNLSFVSAKSYLNANKYYYTRDFFLNPLGYDFEGYPKKSSSEGETCGVYKTYANYGLQESFFVRDTVTPNYKFTYTLQYGEDFGSSLIYYIYDTIRANFTKTSNSAIYSDISDFYGRNIDVLVNLYPIYNISAVIRYAPSNGNFSIKFTQKASKKFYTRNASEAGTDKIKWPENFADRYSCSLEARIKGVTEWKTVKTVTELFGGVYSDGLNVPVSVATIMNKLGKTYYNTEIQLRFRQGYGKSRDSSIVSSPISVYCLKEYNINSFWSSVKCYGQNTGSFSATITDLDTSVYWYSKYRYGKIKSTNWNYISDNEKDSIYVYDRDEKKNIYYYFQTVDTTVMGNKNENSFKLENLSKSVFKIKIGSTNSLYYPSTYTVIISQPDDPVKDSSYIINSWTYNNETYNVATGGNEVNIKLKASGGTPYDYIYSYYLDDEHEEDAYIEHFFYYYSLNGEDYTVFTSDTTIAYTITDISTPVKIYLKDKYGCVPDINPKEILLNRADSIQLANFSKTDITCNYSDKGSSSNGTVSFTFSGGVGGYYLNFTNTDSSKNYIFHENNKGNFSSTSFPAGLYELTITDTTGGSSNKYTFTISQPTALTINSITTPTIACYGDSATAELYSQNSNITSYNASYNNSVESNNTGTFSKTLTPGATYSFYITNTNGCQSSPVSQTMPSAPTAVTISAEVTNATCYVAANGSYKVTASGGWPYASHTYRFGSSSTPESEHTYNGKTKGSYTVMVYDSQCDQPYTGTVVVGLVTDSLRISQITTSPDLCRNRQDGNASGAIEVTIDKGDRVTVGYTAILSHNGNETSKDIGDNCTFGQLPHGSYLVTVKDSFGCSSSDSTNIVLRNDTIRWASDPVITNALCTGVANGKIALSAQNGNGNYTYVLTDNNNNSDTLVAVNDTTFSGLKEGSYTLTVLDDSTCYVTATATVAAAPTPVSFTKVSVTPYYCEKRKGSIIASAASSGSTVTKLKLFFPNNTTDSINNDSLSYYRVLNNSGTYIIKAIDIQGCYADSSVFLKKYHNIPRVSVTSIDSAACNLASNGGFHFKATQDTAIGGFKFYLDDNVAFPSPDSVSNNSDTAAFSGLTPKIYFINVTDSMNCDTLFRDTLPTITLPVTIASKTLIPASCIRAANAGITLTASGSMPQNPGYYFVLDDDTLSGDSVTFKKRAVDNSTHKVYLFDRFGCSNSTNAVFNSQSPILTLTSPTSVNPSCPGYSNGSLELLSSYNDSSSTAFLYQVFKSEALVASYTGGYDYSAGTLPQGTYKVVVTAADNCQDSIDDLTLTDPSPLLLTVNPGYVAAKGASTGWANALATSGNNKYFFEWYRTNTSPENFLSSQTSTDSAQITSLSAGNYIVRVKDTANCKYYNNSEWLPETFVIREPDAALVLTLKSTDTVTCHGLSDGKFVLQGSGGWGSKYYYGSDTTFRNGTSTDFNDLPAGTYTFYVKDTSGVKAQATFVMAQPETLSALVASVTDANCHGSSDGAISLTVTGGNTNFEVSSDNLSWQRGTTLSAIPAGSYTVIARDNKKCTTTASATVNEPTAIVVTDTSITNTQCKVNEGVIIPTIKGGVPGYSYQWYNGDTLMSITSASLNNLYSGQYTLKVTDSHSCLNSFEFYVSDITDLNIDSIFSHAATCWGYSDGWATVKISKGFPPYTKTWNGTYNGDTISGLATGQYSFKVSDSEGCKVYQYYNIGTPDSLHISGTITNPLCYGLSDGSIESLISGGTEPYSYLWSTGRKKYNVTSLDTGTYTLNITDNHGCTKSGTFTLSYQERVQSGIPAALSLCKNNDYTIDGGDFASYLWKQDGTEVSTERRITITEQGTYTLDFEDSRGCKATDTTRVGLSDSQLQAQFLMASQVEQNDTVVIFEASDPIPDSIKISIPASFTVIDSGQYYRYVIVNDTGTFEITLLAYSGGCQAIVRKNIEVVEAGALPVSTQSSKASLIVSAAVRPNPTDGNFTTEIKLSQSCEVYLRLISFGTGKVVNAKRISGSDQYTVHYSLGNLSPGVYLLNIMAGGEMKNLKVVVQ